MDVKIKGLDKLNREIGDMVRRAENAEPAMKAIKIMQLRSIQKNFQQGGRPQRWLPSKRSEALTGANAAKGSSKTGKTLIKTGIFKNSFTGETTRNTLTIGTNFPGGPAHQFGMTINIPEIRPKKGRVLHFIAGDGTEVFTKFVRAHKVKMPKREFMMFHPEDISRAKRAVIDFVVGNV